MGLARIVYWTLVIRIVDSIGHSRVSEAHPENLGWGKRGLARFDTIAVYMMTDRRYGVLYTGVTSDLVHRVSQHRAGEACAFTRTYNCKLLVWYEVHADMRVAIQRETSLKRYRREWKEKLIAESNPDWLDLWSQIRPGPLPGQWISVDELRRGKRLDGGE